MSTSLAVITNKPSIEIQALKQAINESLCKLLFQKCDFNPNIEFERELVPIHGSLIPNGRIFSIYEGNYLNYGLLCCYEQRNHQHQESSAIDYEFSVLEIPRDLDNMLFAFAIAICIGAAKQLGESSIVDYYGVLGRNDEVAIEKVFSASLTERLPLNDALRVFYSRLPV